MGGENEGVVRGRKKGMGEGEQHNSTMRPSRKDY